MVTKYNANNLDDIVVKPGVKKCGGGIVTAQSRRISGIDWQVNAGLQLFREPKLVPRIHIRGSRPLELPNADDLMSSSVFRRHSYTQLVHIHTHIHKHMYKKC